jgi:hypothetical protein
MFTRVAGVHLKFEVSRDEEYVHLEATVGFRRFDLGARRHHYFLLTLARRRLADAMAGLPETTCGWIDREELRFDPSMGPSQVNLDAFRIRRQFQAMGLVDATRIVERRRVTRQIRIGTALVSVERL